MISTANNFEELRSHFIETNQNIFHKQELDN